MAGAMEVYRSMVGAMEVYRSMAGAMKVYRSMAGAMEVIVQELCESRGGRPGLSVLTSLLASVDVNIY